MEEGRNAIMIELNPDYVRMMRRRLAGVTPGLPLMWDAPEASDDGYQEGTAGE